MHRRGARHRANLRRRFALGNILVLAGVLGRRGLFHNEAGRQAGRQVRVGRHKNQRKRGGGTG